MDKDQKFLMTIAYHGALYAGWQTQSNSLAIQDLIEQKLSVILRQPVAVYGSGRTDSGVHALAQTAHFTTTRSITPYRLQHQLNSTLPPSIRIVSISPVDPKFHARFSVKQKTYLYQIWHGPIMNPFLEGLAWHINGPLDRSLMEQAIQKLIGIHDFKAFAAKNSVGPASVDGVRHLSQLSMIYKDELLSFELSCNGFLYKMVRNLVGCLVGIGSKKLCLDAIDNAFNTGSRAVVGMTAPAHGLFLKKVSY